MTTPPRACAPTWRHARVHTRAHTHVLPRCLRPACPQFTLGFVGKWDVFSGCHVYENCEGVHEYGSLCGSNKFAYQCLADKCSCN